MAEDQRATGTPNEVYDAVSVLYHALESGATIEMYIQDAESAGDDELADFFRDVQDEDSRRAERVKNLLSSRIAQ